MKTSSILAGILSLSVAAFAQETVVTSAPTIEAAINNSASNLNATLTQLLNEAERQNEKLQMSLDRMGDPSAVNLPSLTIIENDIEQSKAALKTREEQRNMMTNLTGAEVFDKDALGLMEAIGSTITKEDGTVVDRDPEKYRMDAGVLAQVEEYNQVREKALERKKVLLDEIKAVTQDIEDASDLATIQKYQSMLTLLYAEVEECNQAIHIAQGDVQMTEREIVGQARIMTKAKAEEHELNSPRAAAGTTTGIDGFPNLGTAPQTLPWGRKGSANNPSTGGSSAGGGAAGGDSGGAAGGS